MRIFKLVIWYPNMVQIISNDLVQYTFNFHKDQELFKLFLEYICVFEYIGRLHLFPQIYSNLRPYKMKRNSFFFNILPKLYSNIIYKKLLNFFQNFEVEYI
jgi:hypothetical protein